MYHNYYNNIIIYMEYNYYYCTVVHKRVVLVPRLHVLRCLRWLVHSAKSRSVNTGRYVGTSSGARPLQRR